MEWTYSIKQKIKTAIALLVVIILVITTNIIDKYHFQEIQESFMSVYEDRLLVENYIFQLSHQLNLKKDLLDNQRIDETVLQQSNDKIASLLLSYEETKFTESETQYYDAFKSHLMKLVEAEKLYSSADGDSPKEPLLDKIKKEHIQLHSLLLKLSDIQMEEGKNLIVTSNSIISTNYFYSRMEMVLLIAIGIVIQALLFASKSVRSRIPQNPRLN